VVAEAASELAPLAGAAHELSIDARPALVVGGPATSCTASR
jgi:hypothetical protein